MDTTPRPVPPEILDANEQWLTSHRQWIYAHYLLLVIGNIFAVAATSTAFTEHKTAPYLSLAAALCLGIISVVNPFKIAQANARAHDRLRHAIMQYRNLGTYTLEALLKEFDAAQQIINKGRE